MAEKPTHMLLMETSAGTQIIPLELGRGSDKQMRTTYKKWKQKIETLKLIEVPADLPAAISTSSIVSLRITIMPEEMLKAEAMEKKWAGDPRRANYMKNFMKGAQAVEQKSVEGLDILDQGYKAN